MCDGSLRSPSFPLVRVLSTGGTIASTHTSRGLVPTLSGEELLAPLREEFADRLRLDVRSVRHLDSSSMSAADLDDLAAHVREALADPDISGIVLTHGTDSMEETAMALHLLCPPRMPIILTGAMLPADSPAADGPQNLRLALRCASSPDYRGVRVAFAGHCLPAWGLLKTDTHAAESFASPLPRTGRPPRSLAPDVAAPLPSLAGIEVPIITAYPGAPRSLIESVLDAGARGLVIEAMGAGNVGPELGEGIAAARERGVPVVLSSRVPFGEIATTYGGAGGGAELAELGVLGSGVLRAPQARILLIVALALGREPAELLALGEPGA
ncbi:asparaginase [Corynebacterium uropygiale]|uniref:asparaginase n=1 Tax=Corynebacterium uropygiale TaxID=1775911 RepID=A0A9X1QRQ8_9CORY|nr:asparaginase [Corynebacterium uropygiale]MCF4007531.1 asparaginase [Corynebacterium uropygiale]